MTSHAHAGTARFGPFVLDLRSGELTGNGTRQHLRDKPFEALVLLLEHPGEVVTREELRERLWPSDVFVDFENNLNAAVNRLREALGDSAHEPRYVETLPRRGYRLLVPVTLDSPAEAPRRFRLVVLPLDNLGDDDAHDYFAAGLTEELTTQLAAADPERLGVLARTTASRCAAAGKSIAAIGRDLDVDYVVEGSVRRSVERVRVSVQLIRARDETHVWARSYDAERRDVLALQGDLARAIAHEIEVGGRAGSGPAPGRPGRLRRVPPRPAPRAPLRPARGVGGRHRLLPRGRRPRPPVCPGLGGALADPCEPGVLGRRALRGGSSRCRRRGAPGGGARLARLGGAERAGLRGVAPPLGPGRGREEPAAGGRARAGRAEGPVDALRVPRLDARRLRGGARRGGPRPRARPALPVLRAQVGWVHHWCGRPERAIAHCRAVLAEHPDLVQALHILGSPRW